ncbi:MAG: metalloregulator ArsR/SmtB family transcription factor [bacterium]|nr:metalloregulator ArsR/SmtB family transcription factor [bacterium]
MAGRDPAALFHSLSDASRLRLLRLLRRSELNVQELVSITGLSQPRVSRHLGVLREQGWLRQRREGTWNWYRAVAPEEFPFGADLVARIADVADGVEGAAADDRALEAVLAERQRRSDDFFAGLAGRWDRIRAEYDHPDIGLGTVAALVEPGLKVLDIGTGTGAMLPLLGGVVGTVVALDNSRAMLERARHLCRDEELAGVRLCNGTVETLPFGDGVFDACHCAMALHHAERPAGAVAEMARVVRPGGRIMLTAFCPHEEAWMRDELAHRWLGFARDEIEGHLRGADLTPDGWLVRSRRPNGGTGRAPAGRRKPRWPDVFLATASKNP